MLRVPNSTQTRPLCYCTQHPNCWQNRKLHWTQINRYVRRKWLNLIRPISSLGTEFAVLLLGPSGRKWYGKFSLKKFKCYAYPSGSWMYIQQNSCSKRFINGSDVNKACLTSLACENYNGDVLTMDIKVNTTAYYTCRGIQPTAQDDYERGPNQIVNLLKIYFFCSSVFVRVYIFNVWPKTTLLLPGWPRDNQRFDTPVRRNCFGSHILSYTHL